MRCKMPMQRSREVRSRDALILQTLNARRVGRLDLFKSTLKLSSRFGFRGVNDEKYNLLFISLFLYWTCWTVFFKGG